MADAGDLKSPGLYKPCGFKSRRRHRGRPMPEPTAPNFTHLCDRCGRPLDVREVRFVAKIQVFASPGPIVVEPGEPPHGHSEEIAALIRQCQGMSEEELMRDVFVEFKFDLCIRCQRDYIANPMPLVKGAA